MGEDAPASPPRSAGHEAGGVAAAVLTDAAPTSPASRQRILFVDDEPQILNALENALRRQRRTWDMVFALGGAAALEALDHTAFDVVVSDMQMPGMDGAALLTRVKASHPGVARIILSGHADQDAVVRALPVAHQFLTKPCDGDQLRQAIDRTCGLQQLLRGELVRQMAGRLDRLPSAADAYWALTRALGDPHVSLAGVAAIVERDPAMSAKVLQLVNSAGFGLSRRVTSILEAVQFVGTNTIKGLVLTAQVFSLANRVSVAGLSVSRLQEHSLLTARVAKRLVGRRDIAEDAFAAGLLHDIGQLVLALGVPSRYTAVLADARDHGRPLHTVEYEVLGVSHAEAGAYLLGVWGLPFAVVEAVAYHHRPSPVSEGDRDLLAVTHVAEALVEAGGNDPAVDASFLESGPWTNQLAAWRAMAAEVMTDTGTGAARP